MGSAPPRSPRLLLAHALLVLLLVVAATGGVTSASAAFRAPAEGAPAATRDLRVASTAARGRQATLRARAAAKQRAAAKRKAAARKKAAAKRRAAARRKAAAAKRRKALEAARRAVAASPVAVVAPPATQLPTASTPAPTAPAVTSPVVDAGPAADLPAASDRAPSISWGMNPAAELEDFRFDAADDPGLSAIAGVGTQTLRVAAAWRLADESGAASRGEAGASWDWSWMDSIARGAARHGMRWEPFLCYPPPSLSRDETVVCGGPPKTSAPYVRFATAFIDRYGSGGTFWRANPGLPNLPVSTMEIWNEPNLTTAWPEAPGGLGAPEEYADLYRAVRTAVRSRPAGASVTVEFAALAPIPLSLEGPGQYDWDTFLRRGVARLAGSPVDAFGWHPYISGINADDPTKHVYDLVRAFRTTLRQLGRGSVPMIVNEVGVAANYGWMDPSVMPEGSVVLTELQRAAFYAQVIPVLAASNCGITSISPLMFSSDKEIWNVPAAGGDPMDLARYVATIFSLADPQGNLRLSGVAYKLAVAQVQAGLVKANSVRVCG
ncbi:hypothetical protein [Patulibacter minatonensis]|uniref:hypothetical protein n=1 Tax=Patulibacter minatonensis TaxID=298163 RepID=UPI0004AFF43D|nr:hypothetical protein [Patulibacter minatonensis]